jgi:hypothetical protein
MWGGPVVPVTRSAGPNLPAIGHWHATPFTTAIASARRIVEGEDQKREVEAFLHAAVEISIGALSRNLANYSMRGPTSATMRRPRAGKPALANLLRQT